MPEGDTIYRTASRLRDVLVGCWIADASSREPGVNAASLPNHQISSVEARGKHLLILLDDHRAVHSHMGMTGSWHIYAPGESWRKPQHGASLVLDVRQTIAVCFYPKTLEILSRDGLRRHPHLSRLGPDILAGQPDWAEMLRRFRTYDRTPIGQALMNQTIVCGIGNVYKSEALFATHTNPFTDVQQLSDEQVVDLARQAHRLMRRNLDGYPRRTRFAQDGARQWVYGRQGQPCFICSTPIRMRRQGQLGRSTYWCPQCQAAAVQQHGTP